jgi:hypothetical protein
MASLAYSLTLKLSVLNEVHVLRVARERRHRRKDTENERICKKKESSLCVHSPPPPPPPTAVETESLLPLVAKRRNSPGGPNPLYESTKTFDTQIQAKYP